MRTDRWLSRLLGLWLISFAGLLVLLYMLVIGTEIDGRSMSQIVFR